MSVNRIALGKRISFYRLKFSMTQEKLADLTNCSREYVRRQMPPYNQMGSVSSSPVSSGSSSVGISKSPLSSV